PKHHTERKEHFHVRVIREEAVHQLADRITVKQSGTDEAEFDRSEDTLVNQRLFYDRERKPAGVHEAITEGERHQHAHPVSPVLAVDLVAVGTERLVRAGPEVVEECLQLELAPVSCYGPIPQGLARPRPMPRSTH